MKTLVVEFFERVDNRGKHSKQSIDRLMNWATTNETLKTNTNNYRAFLKAHPEASKKEISDKKLEAFPAITFAGTFNGSGSTEDIKDMSGLICLDIDHISNVTEVYEQLKNDIITYMLFISPSGSGIKLIVKHNLKDPLKFRYLYEELSEYYFNKFNIQADKSCKDISRMCYLPFIENLYKNDNCWIWEYNGNFEHKKVLKSDSTNLAKSDSTTLVELTTDNDFLECTYIADFLNKNSIDITNEYSDWISYGYSIASLGEAGREIYHTISSVSDKYDESECDEQYDYMLQNFDDTKTGINTFINNGKRAIADYMIFKEYGYNCE